MADFPYTFRKEILNIKPYIPGKPIDDVKRELGITDVIKLASNENPLGPSPKAKEAVIAAADKLHIYPDGYCHELRKAVAQKLEVTGEQLIFGNGSDEIIKLLAETFLLPGDEVLTAYPSFSEYDFATYLMGGKMVQVPLEDNRFSLEKIAENITPKTKLIFICNPNNPTGTMVTASEVDEFLKKVPDNVIVVFDEAYNEYVEDENYPDTLRYIKEGKNNIIILRTFSKIYALASLRIGYGIASPELIGLLNRTKEPFNVNALAQYAAIGALNDKEHVQMSKKVNADGKVFLYSAFEELGLQYIPTETNFIMVDTGKDSQTLFQMLLRKGVIVRTGDIFGMNTFIRVTIGTKEENERFINSLKECLQEM